jgi:hypothetical protein
LHATGASVGVSDRWLVQLRVEPDGLVVAARPPDGGAFVARRVATASDLEHALPALRASVRAWANRLSVHTLRAGQRYRVLRDFTDYTGAPFAAGDELVFESSSFLPYDDGHTLRFAERTMYVRGDTTLFDDFGLSLGPA